MEQIKFGVPQRGILGPTFLIIYMNDILNLKIPDSELLCYAEDTVILFNNISYNKTVAAAGKSMKMASDWFRVNLHKVNNNKTKFNCFHKTVSKSKSFIQSQFLDNTF
jgi:hypothetical protein